MATIQQIKLMAIIPFAGMLLGIGLILLLLKVFHLKLNLTASMPIGWYQRISDRPIRRSDLVAVCLPSNVANEGLRRHYVLAGHCAAGTIPLLKQVIAIPQDTVRLSNDTICVNRVCYFAPFQRVDHAGKRPKKWLINGVFSNIQTYWLYGTHDLRDSWDSRYFGGVSRTAIHGIYRAVWTFSALRWPSCFRNCFRNSNTEAITEAITEGNPVKQPHQKNANALKNNLNSDNPLHPPSPIFNYVKNFLTPLSQRPTSC